MSKIKNRTNYWKEFYKKNQDEDLRKFVSEDPILFKIYKFAALPWIFKGIKQHPFDEKMKELETITREDIGHIEDMAIRREGKTEWLDYILNLFTLVRSAIWVYSAAKETGEYKQDEILESVELAFEKYLSVDETIKYKTYNKEKKWTRFIGRYWPFRLVKYILTYNDKGLSTSRYSIICQELFLQKPSDDEIDEVFNELDRFSVLCFKKYGPHVTTECYGGYHPYLDKSSYISFNNIPIEREQFLIELHYKGKRLPIFEVKGKKYYQFIFPIRKRYLPLLKGMVKKTIGKYGRFVDETEDVLRDAELDFLVTARKYDEKKGGSPAAFFFSVLKHFHQNKSKTTESKVFLNIPCNEECRKKKLYEDKLPCEFEHSHGYCKDPKRNPGRRLKTAIDHEGGSLDEYVDTEETLRRFELEEAEPFDIDAEITRKQIIALLNPDERQLYHDYFIEEMPQRILAEKNGCSQPTISRRIKALVEKMIELI